MLLCFADESGTPPKPHQKGRPPFFVIGAVFMHEAQWHSIAQELQQLKDRPEFRVRGEIKWRYFGPANDDSKNSVRHLDQAGRDAFRRAFFDILIKRNSVKAVAAVAKVERCYELPYINTEHELYGYTYKLVSERFQYHLQDISRAVGAPQLGVVVGDHRGRSDDERLRREHQKLVHSSSPFISSYKNLVESLFLTPSHNSVGVQFADMIAGAVARRYNSDDQTWFDHIRPIIRAKVDGAIDGFGIAKLPARW